MKKKVSKKKSKIIVLAAHHDLSLFSAKGDCAQSYAHYYAAKQLVEATDGKVLIQVPVLVEEVEGAFEAPADCMIYHETIKNATKGAQATTQIVTVMDGAEVKRVRLIPHNSTDLNTEQSHEAIDQRFPHTESVTDMWKQAKFTVTLNARILKIIALYALKYSRSDAVDFHFVDNKEMACFEIVLKGDVKAKGFFIPLQPL